MGERELPDTYEDIIEQIEKELDKENGERKDWLLHLALRRMDDRVETVKEQLNTVDERTEDIQDKVDEIHSSKLVSTARWVKWGTFIITGTSLVIAAVSLI